MDRSSVSVVRLTGVTFLLIVLSACANLDAVRSFGTSAAAISAYPDAAKAYRDSAREFEPYRVNQPEPNTAAGDRASQARAAMALEGSVTMYFSVLAKLAGTDAFSIDGEIGAIKNELDSIPVGTLGSQTTVAHTEAAINLLNMVAKYVLLAAQESAVRDLIRDGGPYAMELVDNMAAINSDWQHQVANDYASMDTALNSFALAKDSPKGLQLLLRDRQAHISQDYSTRAKQFETTGNALQRIKSAHSDMVAHLDTLSGAELREKLKAAVSDLNGARTQLQALR